MYFLGDHFFTGKLTEIDKARCYVINILFFSQRNAAAAKKLDILKAI
jgi:hypothetical protein